MMRGRDPRLCAPERHCVTCADEGVPMRVVGRSHADRLATCVDAGGHAWTVQTDLVGEVADGDQLLVHAGVALVRLGQGDAG